MSSAPTIEFVNHASIVIEAAGVRILSDPWLFGPAFHNGWDLISETTFSMDDFASIDYIWFSHEHPDHFSPPVLKSIPESLRQKITVLFQETKDRKVAKFCHGIGFQVRELPNERRVRLHDDLTVCCGKVPFFDSWLLVETAGQRILNINDCVVDGDGKCSRIHKVTGDVDLLCTQFSYAAWKGNVGDKALREESARSKLEIVRTQTKWFHPTWTIPFASFVYFSHEENRYNNDSINHPDDAIAAIEEAGSIPILLYPGDRWTIGREWDNAPALERYSRDYDLESKPYHSAESVDESALIEAAETYVTKIHSNNNRVFLWLASKIPVVGAFKPFNIRLRDYGKTYRFSLRDGLEEVGSDASFDVEMHSESLAYVFTFDWGYDTLTVNGRFRADMDGFDRMTRMFAVGPLNNTGRSIGFRLLFDAGYVRAFLSALAGFVRKMRRFQGGG